MRNNFCISFSGAGGNILLKGTTVYVGTAAVAWRSIPTSWRSSLSRPLRTLFPWMMLGPGGLSYPADLDLLTV